MELNAAKVFGKVGTPRLKTLLRKDFDESKYEIEIERQNPNSSLDPVKTFEALKLNLKLLKGVHEMGFEVPTKLQEIVLPALLTDPPQNLIVHSPYGTGKTVAFVLAMLSRVDPNKHYPQVLCLTPSYRFAIQTGELVGRIGKFFPEINFKFTVRGEKVLPQGCKTTEHVLIGVPSQMLDWGIKYRAFDLSKITVVVLDDADVMISIACFQDQCIRLYKCLDQKCQVMFFSALYNQEVIEFAEMIVINPLIIKLGHEENSFDNIQQYYVKCVNKEEKYNALINIKETVEEDQAIIIFCSTGLTVSLLSEKMKLDGHAVAVFKGGLSFPEWNLLDRFQTGEEKVLITSGAIRGMNIEPATTIINYDLPVGVNGKPNYEAYLDRVLRISKFRKMGIVINLIDSPKALLICKSIVKHFNRKIEFLNIDISRSIIPDNQKKRLIEMEAMKKLLENKIKIEQKVVENMNFINKINRTQRKWTDDEIKLMEAVTWRIEMFFNKDNISCVKE